MGKRKEVMTVPAAIRELEKIELTRQLDNIYRLDHAVTATQKSILNAFNLTEQDIKLAATIISNEILTTKQPIVVLSAKIIGS